MQNSQASRQDGNKPILYIFSGLPGAGKSTLAQRLAQKLGCAYIRIDTIEQTLRDVCSLAVEAEGYELAYRLASDHLEIGISAVTDSCNPLAVTRTAWQEVALRNSAAYLNIEIVCTDKAEHRHRVETRPSSVPGLTLPTWTDVENREYEAWTGDRIIIDTSGQTIDQSFAQLCAALVTLP